MTDALNPVHDIKSFWSSEENNFSCHLNCSLKSFRTYGLRKFHLCKEITKACIVSNLLNLSTCVLNWSLIMDITSSVLPLYFHVYCLHIKYVDHGIKWWNVHQHSIGKCTLTVSCVGQLGRESFNNGDFMFYGCSSTCISTYVRSSRVRINF